MVISSSLPFSYRTRLSIPGCPKHSCLFWLSDEEKKVYSFEISWLKDSLKNENEKLIPIKNNKNSFFFIQCQSYKAFFFSFICNWSCGKSKLGCFPPSSNHRHLSNIDRLMARTACLVCFISTVNDHSKKKRK